MVPAPPNKSFRNQRGAIEVSISGSLLWDGIGGGGGGGREDGEELKESIDFGADVM